MQVFTQVLIVAFLIIAMISLHEFIHWLIYRIQGVNIIAFGILIFNFIGKKLSVALSGIYTFGGYVIIDTSQYHTIDKMKELTKKIRINHIFTNLIHLLIILIQAIIFIYSYLTNKVLITNTFFITLGVLNIMFLYGSLASDYGDIKITSKFSENKLTVYSYICSSEILTGFTNKTLFTLSTQGIGEIEQINRANFLTMGLVDYLLNYHLYKNVNYDANLERLVLQLKVVRGLGEYLIYKLYLLKLIKSQISEDQITSLDDKILNKYYNNELNNICFKLQKGEKITASDLSISRRYKLFSKSEDFQNFIDVVIQKINSCELHNAIK